jgi:hypothetical protein
VQRDPRGVTRVVDHAVHTLVEREQVRLDPMRIRDPDQEAPPAVLDQVRWRRARRTARQPVLVDPRVDQHEWPQQLLELETPLRVSRRAAVHRGQLADHVGGQRIAEIFQFPYGADR